MGTSATYTMLIILREKSRGYLFFEKGGGAAGQPSLLSFYLVTLLLLF